jgi:hypothetical protein
VPPLRRENVQESLRAQDLADRGCERRPAGLGADLVELFENVVEAIRDASRAQLVVELGHEPGRKPVLCGAHRHSRRERRHGLVSERLVDELGAPPKRVDVDSRVEIQARK